MMKNLYIGHRTRYRIVVVVNNKPLPKCKKLRNHSPTGFEWGYCGSGPAQLALAILAFEFGKQIALDHYQQFKRDVVASWKSDWMLASSDIVAWMDKAIAKKEVGSNG